MDNKKIKFINSVIMGAIAAVIFIASITVVADLAPNVKNWLMNIFSHHWVGKSILSLAIFAAMSFVFYICPCVQSGIEKTKKLLSCLFWVSICSAIAIFLFFVWEVFLR